jgi:CheY-like chemotaxis protein
MVKQSEPYKGKILVINDVPGIRNRLARWLAGTGYHYTFVDSAAEAEALLAQAAFDITAYGHEFLFPPWSFMSITFQRKDGKPPPHHKTRG